MDDPTCPGCGEMLVPRTYRGASPKIYCSPRCYQKVNRRRKPEMYAAIEARSLAKQSEKRAQTRTPCIVCGGKRQTSRGVACNSRDCQLEMKRRRQRTKYWSDPSAELERFARQRANRSPERIAEDKAKARARNKAAGYSAAKQAGDVRRRARQRTAIIENFDRREVFARDRWKCGICGKKIHADRTSPNPMSASVDHIVPISLGGPHTLANVRAAHLGCNMDRSNARHETLQLTLI